MKNFWECFSFLLAAARKNSAFFTPNLFLCGLSRCSVSSKSFFERVWTSCAKVPKGRVTTYREISRKLGSKAYRVVGHALNQNPHGFVHGNKKVPCHRVVCFDGRLGGFAHGSAAKKRLLEKEGVHIKNGRVTGFEDVLFRF